MLINRFSLLKCLCHPIYLFIEFKNFFPIITIQYLTQHSRGCPRKPYVSQTFRASLQGLTLIFCPSRPVQAPSSLWILTYLHTKDSKVLTIKQDNFQSWRNSQYLHIFRDLAKLNNYSYIKVTPLRSPQHKGEDDRSRH